MPILNYFSVTSSATPISPDTPPQPPNPNTQRLPTKIILPSKNPTKWSTGVAPGDYGGPPLTTKLRRYWGGEGEDPLTSSDFIWNKDFMPRMKRLFQDPEDAAAQASPKEEESSGFLSLHRVMSLDSMDIDLSKELAAPSKRIVQRPAETVTRVAKSTSPKWKFAPTQREQDKWDRATKAATGGSEAMFRELRKPKGDPAVLAAESREQYYKLKNKLQLLTVGIGSVGLVSAYVSYSTEITASFGVGFIGSLIYMRMLGKSIDSMADGAGGLIKIVVPEYGFVHLELIPMLVGFFTYKIATFAQAIEEALKVPDGNSDA
ncbi:Protein CONSERVED ONLY IN THE GREEN LINEAGE 160, chloroplastic [Linum perenne]